MEEWDNILTSLVFNRTVVVQDSFNALKLVPVEYILGFDFHDIELEKGEYYSARVYRTLVLNSDEFGVSAVQMEELKRRILRIKFFKTREEIDCWLKRYGVKNYVINEDLTVDVKEVKLKNLELSEIPVKFGYCEHFLCSENKLRSLHFSPRVVRYFNCSANQLISLSGGPVSAKYYACTSNLLISLEGIPSDALEIYCGNNRLKSLEGVNFYGDLMRLQCSQELKESDLYKRWELYKKLRT